MSLQVSSSQIVVSFVVACSQLFGAVLVSFCKGSGGEASVVVERVLHRFWLRRCGRSNAIAKGFVRRVEATGPLRSTATGPCPITGISVAKFSQHPCKQRAGYDEVTMPTKVECDKG